ncbi:hypothetical protein [Winogradskyella luteola]|uniref:Uncharacterized protein n=1 Tax=Winogradskyella luteola TaxID=2828330 RepID=A0A9X1F648_9FLAO|nr:hypothetical protein [Winogradskyella luteola]MBV7268081.1 hypothetical protein [Winogradskyella luteola]
MGEIIGGMIVFTILNFIGGSIRWFFATTWKLIFNTPKHSFREYIYSSEEDILRHDGANGCLNTIIGIAFVVLVVIIISRI